MAWESRPSRIGSSPWIDGSRITEAVQRTRPAPAPNPPGVGTRPRILDTAKRLFAREGPSAVTLRSIASAAGVIDPFGSKENLFEAMFLRRIVPLHASRWRGLAAGLSSRGSRRHGRGGPRIGEAALVFGPTLAALDVNPLWVRGDQVEALDALCVWQNDRAQISA